MLPTHDFTGKVAFVSGAAAGIGRATALAFGRSGALVVLADIDAKRGSGVAAEINATGGIARFVQADMVDEAAVARLFASIEEQEGRIDFAHNNVGFGFGDGVLGTSLDAWRKTLDLSLTANFLCLKAEIQLMKAQGSGAIVNTASMAGVRYAPPACAAYSTAKAGLIHLTRYAAMAHAADGIRVNSVSPGLVRTEALAQFMDADQQIAFASRTQPIGRPVETEEIAATVLWLCSESAAMISGENVHVAGGMQAL